MKLTPFAAFTAVLLQCLACSDGSTIADESGAAGSGGIVNVAGASGSSSTSSGSGGSASGGPGGGALSAGASSGGASSGGASSGGTQTQSAGNPGAAGSSGGVASTAGSGGGAGVGGSTPLDGQGLYFSSCQACHGDKGVGGQLAPELQHPVRDYAAWVVRHGRASTTYPKPMEIFATDKISDAALSMIWDYLDQPAQPTTGQALYLDYCANCHGADAKGGPTMRNILNEVSKLKSMVRSGKAAGQFDQRREYMPAFATSRISDAELDLIYQYVDGL
jgi:mono/diheme cytochrome c family protein